MAKRSGAVAFALLAPATMAMAVVLIAEESIAESSGADRATGDRSAVAKGPSAAAPSAPPPRGAATPGDEDPAVQFGRACGEGTARFLKGDAKGALESFQGAVRIAPKNPLGHYLSAEAHAALGETAEAEAALRRAEASTDARAPQLRSKILFLTAAVKERAKKWDEARAAWQAYNEWVLKAPSGAGTFPMSATARLKAIDEALKRDKAVEAVRARIDASAGGTVYNEMPPGAK